MSDFHYVITPEPAGFVVSATADRAPVRVALREWCWHVGPADDQGYMPPDDVGLICTRGLVEKIATGMCRARFGGTRQENVRVKYGEIPRTARGIHHRVLCEVKRLSGGVPDEVIATQRAMFAATFGTGLTAAPQLYRPEYATLRSDIRRYRAAAAALAEGERLVGAARRNAVVSSPEFAAFRAVAQRSGLLVEESGMLFQLGSETAGPRDILARLAEDWRGVFSPDGRPYRTLNRTLMNLPGGIPPRMLAHLSYVRLPRPVTDRVELLAILAACAQFSRRTFRDGPPANLRPFLHADRSQVLRMVAMVSEATRTPLSARRTADICRAAGYVCDLPEAHRGNVTGLTRKAIRWHRDVADREAVKVMEQLRDRSVARPPVPLPEIAGVSFLASVPAIVAEGTEMDHCAATYAADAVAGRTFLFHIEHAGDAATAEVSPFGQVVQVQGPGNRDNGACRWGRRVLARWGRGFPEGIPAPALPAGEDPWGDPQPLAPAAEVPW